MHPPASVQPQATHTCLQPLPLFSKSALLIHLCLSYRLHILRIFYCVIVINLPDTTEGNFLNSLLYINIYAKSHLQCNKGDTLPVWGTGAWTPLTATTLLNIAAATGNNTLLEHHCYFTIFNYVFMCMSLHASPGAFGGGKVVVNYPTWVLVTELSLLQEQSMKSPLQPHRFQLALYSSF